MWWKWLLSLEGRRKRLLRSTPPGPLRDYLSVPFPAPRSDCRAVRFTAVDLETTGLDPASDEIVSVGWVCLRGSRIDLSTAGHLVVRPTRAMPQASAIVHHITDDVAARGSPLPAALERLLGVLAGSVLVAHNAAFELQFLDAACASAFGGGFLAPAVDTLEIAVRSVPWRTAWEPAAGAALRLPGDRPGLRLAALRRSYNLPRYPAHDALSDALAAAEVFIAQLARGGTNRLPLRRFLLAA